MSCMCTARKHARTVVNYKRVTNFETIRLKKKKFENEIQYSVCSRPDNTTQRVTLVCIVVCLWTLLTSPLSIAKKTFGQKYETPESLRPLPEHLPPEVPRFKQVLRVTDESFLPVDRARLQRNADVIALRYARHAYRLRARSLIILRTGTTRDLHSALGRALYRDIVFSASGVCVCKEHERKIKKRCGQSSRGNVRV